MATQEDQTPLVDGAFSPAQPQSSAATPRAPASDSYVPAAGDIERRLVEIWERSFDRRPIGVEDSFSDLGGDSLLAIELFIQIEEEFGERLAFDVLVESPTIRAIGRLLAKPAESNSPMLVTLRAGGSRPPLFCFPGISGSLLEFQPFAECLGPDQPAYGLRPRGADGREPPHTSISDWAADTIAAMRSLQPEGPYCVIGFSLGGVLAFEVARQLEAAGQSMGLVALVDSQLWTREMRLSFIERLRMHAWKIWHNDDGGRWRYLVTRWRLLAARVRRHNLRHQPEDLVLGLDCPQQVRDVAKVYFAALQEYRAGLYHGTITLFTAADRWGQPEIPTNDETLGWSRWVEGHVDLQVIPTTHTQMLTRPHVATLARAVEMRLNRVAVEPSGLRGA